MKLNKLFIALAAGLFAFIACEKEGATSLDVIQLDKTYLSIPVEGGDAVLTINAKEAWAFAKDVVIGKDDNKKDICDFLPGWLTASTLSGEAGETKVTFHADAIDGGREQELHILVGEGENQKIQFLVIRQGELAPVKATCAEVIAGADGKSFTVTGIVTNIENTLYGNWWLEDKTGKIYIYGTLDKEGKTKNFSSLGIENGDKITVQGPKTTYGDKIELVDVTVIELVKSLVKVDLEQVEMPKEGGEFTVKAAYKGKGVYVNPGVDWIALSSMSYINGIPTKLEPNPADTAMISFHVLPNEAVIPRIGIVEFSSSTIDEDKKLISSSMEVVVKQGANAPDLMTIADGIKAGYAHVKGRIMAICARGYILADETGAFLAYYGKAFKADQYKIGDEIELIDEFTHYNFGLQMSCDGKEGFILENKLSEGTGTVTYPSPKVIDQEALAAYIASVKGKTSSVETCIPVEYVQLTGTPKKSGNYINIYLDGYTDADFSAYQLPASFDLAAMVDKKITVRGYTQSISGGKHLSIVFTEMIEGEAEVPAIEYTDLAAINALEKNAEFSLTAVVAAVKSDAAIVTDGKACFYLYKPSTAVEVGDIVTAAGKISIYNGLIESAQAPTVTVVEKGAEVILPESQDITSTFDAFLASDKPATYFCAMGQYVVDGTYTNLVVDGATKKGSLRDGKLDASFNGKNVKVTGFFTGSDKNRNYIYTYVTDIEAL